MSCRRIFFLCLLINGFAGISCSTIQKPFYWKIEKDGKTSYVLGTLHRGIEMREFPDEIHRELEQSRAVLLEVTTESEKENPFTYLNRVKTVEDMKALVRQTFIKHMAEKTSVKVFFTAEQWERIASRVGSTIGVEKEVVAYYPLQLINAVLTDRTNVFVPKYEYSLLTSMPLDLEIEGKSIKAKKALYRLDSLQIMKPACWDKMLVSSILFQLENDKYDVVGKLVRTVDVYRSGDADDFIKDTNDLDKDFEKCLLEERNARWIPIIQKHHAAETPVFIAAGVLHFIGAGNVLELLVKQGYRVQRFPFK